MAILLASQMATTLTYANIHYDLKTKSIHWFPYKKIPHSPLCHRHNRKQYPQKQHKSELFTEAPKKGRESAPGVDLMCHLSPKIACQHFSIRWRVSAWRLIRSSRRQEQNGNLPVSLTWWGLESRWGSSFFVASGNWYVCSYRFSFASVWWLIFFYVWRWFF